MKYIKRCARGLSCVRPKRGDTRSRDEAKRRRRRRAGWSGDEERAGTDGARPTPLSTTLSDRRVRPSDRGGNHDRRGLLCSVGGATLPVRGKISSSCVRRVVALRGTRAAAFTSPVARTGSRHLVGGGDDGPVMSNRLRR